ncbi:MAG: hypothetical protein WA971_04895 [Microbacterium sp.]
MTTFDPRPLIDPVDPAAVKAFAREMKAQHPPSAAQRAVVIIAVVIVLLLVVPTLMVVVGGVVAFGMFGGGNSGALAAGGTVLAAVVVAAVVGGLIALFVRQTRRARLTSYRIAHFATANGMSWRGRIDAPPLPGMIFQQGSGRMATDAVRGTAPRFVEFGNYQYTTGSGKNQTTHRWGYVAVKLDVPLPNIVLDALGNNTLGSNLPASFSKRQRLSLEGDFDRYFTLYCPEGYERDALYLFTPDVMARFIDHAAQLDVEIVDDWLFLYMQRPASTLDPQTWAWLFGAVGALLAKFDQWARWRDDRLPAVTPTTGDPAASAVYDSFGRLPFAAPTGLHTPPPGVAPQGRRLRRGVSWVTIVVAAVVVGVWLLPQLIGTLLTIFLR